MFGQQRTADCLQFFSIVDLRFAADALAGTFRNRFGEQRIGQLDVAHAALLVYHHEVGRGHAGSTHHVFRHALVQGQCADQRVRKNVRDLVRIQQCRHLGLAAPAVHPFADVEYQVPAVPRNESSCQLLQVTDTVDLVTQRRQCVGNVVDGVGAIEFRRIQFAVARFQPGVAKIVGEADAQFAASIHDQDSCNCEC